MDLGYIITLNACVLVLKQQSSGLKSVFYKDMVALGRVDYKG